MKERVYLAIDNGTTGTLALIRASGEVIFFIETPKIIEQSYTKKKQNISRIDSVTLKKLLKDTITEDMNVLAIIERPLINPSSRFFKTSISAARSLEATLVILEDLKIARQFEDSKSWQKLMLPHGVIGTGSPALKKASKDISIRLFPQYESLIKKHKDGDALLIGEWARRTGL